jgi:hypothetical protein
MHRRSFLAGTSGLTALALAHRQTFAQATPAPEMPTLDMELTDSSITLPAETTAGWVTITNTNAGASADAHTVVALLPDGMTEDDFITVLQSEDDAGFDFSHIDGVGSPDWPRPGKSVSGVAELKPGLHVAFDPFGSRGYAFMNVTGELTTDSAAPAGDLEFTIGEMVINLPKGPFEAGPARWQVHNLGALTHELAILTVPEGFTFDDFMALMMLGEDATPTPDMKVIEYLPVAAIGLLGPQRSSVLEVDLAPASHYMAVCMFPDDQGIPHAMNGMYAFFDIA